LKSHTHSTDNRATVNDGQTPIKVLGAKVARHTMPEQQLKTPMKELRQEDGTRVKESYEQLRHTKELGLVEESYAQHRQSHDRQRRTDTYKGARCESRPSYYARATAQIPHEGATARRWDACKE